MNRDGKFNCEGNETFESKMVVNDFFKSSKNRRYSSVANMFKDNDRDGVANVFDCRPNNRNKQGILSAITGAVGGAFKGTGIKSGWKAGMAKPGVVASYKTNYGEAMARRRERRASQAPVSNELPEQTELKRRLRMQGYKNVAVKTMKGAAKLPYISAVVGTVGGITRTMTTNPNPHIRRQQDLGGRIHGYQKQIESGLLTPKEKIQMESRIRNAQTEMEKSKYALGIQRQKVRMNAIKVALPMIPAQAFVRQGDEGVGYQTQYYQGKKGYAGRGRPKGSVKFRDAYGNPIGVFQYRKLIRAQKQAERYQQMLRQQQMYTQMSPQQIQQMQMQEQMQMQQQVPQETQGYPTQNQQIRRYPQQIPQQFQQMPQVEQRRPIATVFRSFGGHPYPPVNSQPMTPSNAYSDMIEDVDLMTGRRFFRPKPKPERWSAGY